MYNNDAVTSRQIPSLSGSAWMTSSIFSNFHTIKTVLKWICISSWWQMIRRSDFLHATICNALHTYSCSQIFQHIPRCSQPLGNYVQQLCKVCSYSSSILRKSVQLHIFSIHERLYITVSLQFHFSFAAASVQLCCSFAAVCKSAQLHISSVHEKLYIAVSLQLPYSFAAASL